MVHSTPTSAPPVGADAFRRSMSRIPTAVTVITAPTGEGPVGMTVGSFSAVSQDPPLFMFFAKRSSTSAARVIAAGLFGATVLSRGQEDLAMTFAAPDRDRFAGLDLLTCCNGAPRLPGGLVWAECEISDVFDAGDHVGVMGRAVHLEYSSEVGHPLTFFKHKLCRLDPGAGRHLPTETFAWW